MLDDNNCSTCCFTGHRMLPKYKIITIVKRLDKEVENLINQGVTDFISGGAVGFDLIAASLIIAKKELRKPIKLIFALPFPNHDKRWNENEKRLLHDLLAEADEVIYVSNEYSDNCMEKRNEYMVNQSKFCICALLKKRSGTSQTVNFAKEKNLTVINVAE